MAVEYLGTSEVGTEPGANFANDIYRYEGIRSLIRKVRNYFYVNIGFRNYFFVNIGLKELCRNHDHRYRGEKNEDEGRW